MFIIALFTTASTWKQPKYSSTKEQINMWYNGILLKHKKSEILPFAETWMELESVIESEVSQKKKNKYCIISCMKSREKIQMDLFVKQNRDTYIKKNFMDIKEGREV